ncbi:hypothetical protein [Bacteroides difficilis]|uniref:hypothetical protein n=1 Tax=Bacteroides difficilis TaxID=2763021 RepID=UPI003AB030FA
MNEFLSIPEFIWELIFKVIEVLAVGLILGAFASHYQKRKEYEIKIKSEILKLRLAAYERIAKMTYKIYNLIAPSYQDQIKLGQLLDGQPYKFTNLEYSSFFQNQQCFDEYYREIGAIAGEEKVYFDYPMEECVSQYMEYLTEIKELLDAFVDTEHIINNKFDDKTIQQHINLAYQVVGIALQRDFARFYAIIDKKIAFQLRHIHLNYEDQYLKRSYNKIRRKLIVWLEKYISQTNWIGRQATWAYYHLFYSLYGNSQLLHYPQYLCIMFMYIHYSNKFSRDEFDNLPKDIQHKYINKFHTIFNSQYHHA